jgi:hypothetical protein
LKKADKLNEEHDKNKPVKEVKEPVNISWKQFKSTFKNKEQIDLSTPLLRTTGTYKNKKQ